jgi:hypothetical protein
MMTTLFFCQTKLSAAIINELNCSSVEQLDAISCCFSLTYDYNFPQGVTSIETSLLDLGVTFSSISYALGGDWSYETLQNKRKLRWLYRAGLEIPAGNQTIFDFCLSGWNAADSVALEVTWRVNNTVAKRDTLMMGCINCWEAEEEEVLCQADSSYIYTFDFSNESGFPVDYLLIREPSGQDFIVEEALFPTDVIAVGESFTGLELQLRSTAAGLSTVCFEMTPRRLLNDSIAVDCCTATYCIPLPDCDRCCTDYESFTADVAAGFRIDISCENENVRLQANQLNDCDRVQFEVVGLTDIWIDGNEMTVIGGLEENQTYEVCMTVTRQDRSGEACYEAASLTICDSFYYDCDNCQEPEQINLNFDCPVELDLVCGCDSMTYFNACAAENWAGLTLWEEGRSCNDPQLENIPLTVTYLQQNMESRLDWSVGGLVAYRYFLVQRKNSDQGEWLTIDLLDPSVFTYFDPVDQSGIYQYRIVGVVINGKVVFSNEDMVVDVESETTEVSVKLWPNPVSEVLYLLFPREEYWSLEIRNTQGQLLLQYETDFYGSATIDLNSWPKGCYIITGYLPTGMFWRRKFIKG